MNNYLAFSVSGIPLSTTNSNYLNGIKRIIELNLDGMEIPFTRFVNMSEETAIKFKEIIDNESASRGKKISISVHAPYFINLNAENEEKRDISISRVLKAAERGAIAGASNIVFHPGFYVKFSREDALNNMKVSFKKMLDLYYSGVSDKSLMPILRPETTGKLNQFGKVDELISLCKEFENTLPCIDFSHLHALTGKNNTYDEFIDILKKFKEGLGERVIKNMHIHYSGIEFSDKGEKKHLSLQESDANYKDFMRALKDMEVTGTVVCESPEMENDTILLRDTYNNL